MKKVVVFGEIFSPNMGDGIIFECIKWGLERRGFNVHPCDISLRMPFSVQAGVHSPSGNEVTVGRIRQIFRIFVRGSLTLRRIITAGQWFCFERGRFYRRFQKEIQGADVVVIGGGQIIVDRQLGFPLRIAAIVNLAKKYEKKIIIFSCGADRNQGFIAKKIFKKMARAAAFINVRDGASREFLLGLDPKLEVSVCPDVGFLTSSVYPLERSFVKKIVGVNIMPHATFAAFMKLNDAYTKVEYKNSWEKFVQELLDYGWQVALMTNGDPLDVEAAKEIYGRFSPDRRVTMLSAPTRPLDLAYQIQGVNAMIASRMHAGIVAYSYRRNVVPIIWDEKVSAMWAEADSRVVPLDASKSLPKFRIPSFNEDAKDILENRLDSIKNQIHIAIEKMIVSIL